MDEVLKIVIADDNEVLVDMMKKWIEENERYQVIGMARDRNDEMYLIDTLKPNVVITDIKEKDGCTGLDVVEKYMDSEYKPIFFIVSAGVIGYFNDIRRLKISHYLSKPFEVKDLNRVLNNIYDEVYPKAILELENNITERVDRSFWYMLIQKIKRIGQ